MNLVLIIIVILLAGRYLLPNAVTQHSWQTGETSNLVRMRTQALGQSAPSLTASLVSYISKYLYSKKKKINVNIMLWLGFYLHKVK